VALEERDTDEGKSHPMNGTVAGIEYRTETVTGSP
jgi:hypothetical protein